MYYSYIEQSIDSVNVDISMPAVSRVFLCDPTPTLRCPHDPRHTTRGDSPLLSKIVPQRPKFTDYHLSGDLDGWVSVDFTDGPPVNKKLAHMSTEGKVHELTEPIHMTSDDVQSISERTQQLSSSNTNGIHATFAEDDRLRQSYDSILNLLHGAGGRSGDKLQDTYSKPISLSGQHVQPDLSLELKQSGI